MYSSHYMYLDLVIFTYIVFFIKDDDVFFSPYHKHVVSFLSLYTCFLVYITCLYFTLDALMDPV